MSINELLGNIKNRINKFFSRKYDLSFGYFFAHGVIIFCVSAVITIFFIIKTPIIKRLNLVGKNSNISINDFLNNTINMGDIPDDEDFLDQYYSYLGMNKSFPLREQIEHAIFSIDSLNREIELWRVYSKNISDILLGKKSPIVKEDSLRKVVSSKRSVAESRIALDSILRDKVSYNLDSKMYAPINGSVTKRFSHKDDHLGIEITPKAQFSHINATNQGTIMDIQNNHPYGYAVYIQHENNMISIYRNITSVLKNRGEFVRTQEAIGILGNEYNKNSAVKISMKYELWINGIAVNPENHLIF